MRSLPILLNAGLQANLTAGRLRCSLIPQKLDQPPNRLRLRQSGRERPLLTGPGRPQANKTGVAHAQNLSVTSVMAANDAAVA